MPEALTDPDIPASALPAWQAYRAMAASKDAHFEFLEGLERKYEAGGVRTLAERARLDQLLAEHSRCVAAFRAAMIDLAQRDVPARTRLVRFLAELNASVGRTDGDPH